MRKTNTLEVNENCEFYTSKEVKSHLKIQDCNLAHLRQQGRLSFIKKGNAFLYDKTSIHEFALSLEGKKV